MKNVNSMYFLETTLIRICHNKWHGVSRTRYGYDMKDIFFPSSKRNVYVIGILNNFSEASGVGKMGARSNHRLTNW